MDTKEAIKKPHQCVGTKVHILKEFLIQIINAGEWWHVTPRDSNAYKKRGKFLASTYLQAEFYGRPKLEPERVEIKNPIFGFSENEILKQLFKSTGLNLFEDIENSKKDFYRKRIVLDAKMYKKAKLLGYDSIVLMTAQGKTALQKRRKPNSIELNLMQ
jgi:hypothetical protein